jgi:programmed cell death 6-interacting protein
LCASLAPSISEIDSIKKEIQNASAYKVDVEQIRKFKDLFLTNYQNAMILNKYFVFGTGSSQINNRFIWYDSFNKRRAESFNPIFDALSSKYNVGVCLARMGCYMKLDGDGIKHACKYFQQAAWIFNDLVPQVSQLKPGETGPDFTKEALEMLANLCLAQAQYLFYKLATDKKQSPEILSKTAQQISAYF